MTHDIQTPKAPEWPDFDDLIGSNGEEAQLKALRQQDAAIKHGGSDTPAEAEKREREISELLARVGVTKDEVENSAIVDSDDPMAVLAAAQGSSPAFEPYNPEIFDECGGVRLDLIKPAESSTAEPGEVHWTELLNSEVTQATEATKGRDQFTFTEDTIPVEQKKIAEALAQTQKPIRDDGSDPFDSAPVLFDNGHDLDALAGELTDKMVPQFGEIMRRYDSQALAAYGFPPAIDALITRTQIDENRAAMVLDGYQKAFALAKQWEEKAFAIVVTDEGQEDLISEAARLYKIVQSQRIESEKRRKDIKEPALRECQLIDGVANIWKDLIKPIEDHLKKQKDFALERLKERQEKIRGERWAKLSLFVDKAPSVDLGKIPEEEWELLYKGAVAQYNERKSAEAAEEQRRQQELADAQAKAEQAEQARKEAEAARALEAEKAAEAERVAAEARQRAEESERQLALQEQARKDEEARIAREEEIKRLAPDAEKLSIFFTELARYGQALPPVTEKAAVDLLDEFTEAHSGLINRFAVRARALAEVK